MAGHARFTAVLYACVYACVLCPACVVSVLVSIAFAGVVAARWFVRIEEESI